MSTGRRRKYTVLSTFRRDSDSTLGGGSSACGWRCSSPAPLASLPLIFINCKDSAFSVLVNRSPSPSGANPKLILNEACRRRFVCCSCKLLRCAQSWRIKPVICRPQLQSLLFHPSLFFVTCSRPRRPCSFFPIRRLSISLPRPRRRQGRWKQARLQLLHQDERLRLQGSGRSGLLAPHHVIARD